MPELTGLDRGGREVTNSITGGVVEGGLGGLTCSQGRLTCRHVEPTIRLPGAGRGGGRGLRKVGSEKWGGVSKGKKKVAEIRGVNDELLFIK